MRREFTSVVFAVAVPERLLAYVTSNVSNRSDPTCPKTPTSASCFPARL
jgi:hypothetical protein